MATKRTTTIKIDGGLTPDDLRAVNQLLKEVADTGELCEKCKACKLDVNREVADNNEQRAVLEAIKRQFFPQSP